MRLRQLVPLISGSEPPEPPLSWLCAQENALTLITLGESRWGKASFEHRAAHEVLALTLVLSGTAAMGHGLAASDRANLLRLLADDVEWAVWCQGSLDHPPSELTASDIEMSRAAWSWLTHSRLVAGSLPDICSRGVAVCPGIGMALGVAMARNAVGLNRRLR
jgi:hypothetical protein